MISVSLFLIIVTSGMGALLNANALHRKSQDMRSIMDNLSFVLEDMSRSIRTGRNFQCFTSSEPTLTPASLGAPQSCPGGWALVFESSAGDTSTYADQWVYYISTDGKIFKSTDGANNFIQLTSNEIVIDSVSQFSVLGAPSILTDRQQPFVTIKLVGKITTRNVVTPFSLQTSVSQRLVDY
jgi:hypothetical protein